jgi:hypothetical protein
MYQRSRWCGDEEQDDDDNGLMMMVMEDIEVVDTDVDGLAAVMLLPVTVLFSSKAAISLYCFKVN